METRPVLLPDGGVEDNTKGGVVWSERVVLDWFYFVFYSQLFLYVGGRRLAVRLHDTVTLSHSGSLFTLFCIQLLLWITFIS